MWAKRVLLSYLVCIPIPSRKFVLTDSLVAVGSAAACAIYLVWDYILRNAQQQRKPWSLKEEYRRLPLACIGGPLFAISLFWLGWTARPSVHWIVPVLAGFPCGIGYLLIFMALLK